jgi:toxin-antitoxin system PIN domain toxin
MALTHRRHTHNRIAADWFDEREETMYFCRFTQLALLRLLTSEQVMGSDVRTQQEAWQAYHRWFEDERVAFHREPESPEFETIFQELSSRGAHLPKLWADAYLAAFAKASGLTLVTFDRGFQAMPAVRAIVLP